MLFLADVTPFDWQRLWWPGEHPPLFGLEVVFRCVATYLMLLATLRITGRRSVKQLSLFELSLIIGLGSIAGDTMFYPEVPLSHAVIVFGVVIGLYILLNYLTEISPRFSDWMEGKETQLLLDGQLCWETFHQENLTHKELFGELRQQQVEHLGQVRAVYSEATGEISVFFYEDADVRPGLPIRPEELAKGRDTIEAAGSHACLNCGYVADLPPLPAFACPVCREGRWLPACTTRRVT
jgi:uncharacterized membrane protein YcaP (DUF421 family)